MSVGAEPELTHGSLHCLCLYGKRFPASGRTSLRWFLSGNKAGHTEGRSLITSHTSSVRDCSLLRLLSLVRLSASRVTGRYKSCPWGQRERLEEIAAPPGRPFPPPSAPAAGLVMGAGVVGVSDTRAHDLPPSSLPTICSDPQSGWEQPPAI